MKYEPEYKIGDVYWYVAYGTGRKLKLYSIKICSGQDFGKGIERFRTKELAEDYINIQNKK